MRRFSSYGPVNDKLHYYAPRKELIERAYKQLMGKIPRKVAIILLFGLPGKSVKPGPCRKYSFACKKIPVMMYSKSTWNT